MAKPTLWSDESVDGSADRPTVLEQVVRQRITAGSRLAEEYPCPVQGEGVSDRPAEVNRLDIRASTCVLEVEDAPAHRRHVGVAFDEYRFVAISLRGVEFRVPAPDEETVRGAFIAANQEHAKTRERRHARLVLFPDGDDDGDARASEDERDRNGGVEDDEV